MPVWSQKAPADPLLAIGCTDAVPIASGGYSVVYRARQPEFNRLVALKVLTLPVGDERGRRRFERELNLAGQLTGHPNVVSVFGSGFLTDGRGYVMMEYCPGGSLAERLAAEGVLPVHDVVSIGVKICGVLELAAREGIVHRDVKPGNVLVTRFGEPALSDFGVAVAAGETTGTTTKALTPSHSAPELLESGEVGPPADQWALASTLYTLLAGRPPFAVDEREGMLAGMLRVLSDPVPTIARADLPPDLPGVLERAMAKAPGDRWPSAGDFGRALQEVERSAGWPVTVLPDREVPDAHRGSPARGGDRRFDEATGQRPGTAWAPTAEPPESASAPTAEQPGRTWEPTAERAETASAPTAEHPGRPSATTADPAEGAALAPTAERAENASVFDQDTRTWAKRPTPPPAPPVEPPASRRPWRLAVAGLAAVVVVLAAVVGVLVVRGSPAPKKPAPHPTLRPPSATLAAKLAPRNVEIVNEQPTTVTIRWTDPNHGLYPFVVKWSGVWHKATGNTETVVAGLKPSEGYCFVVAAVYGVGGQTADAAPQCIRGATPPSTARTQAS